MGGLTFPPLDENVDDYDVKLIFKPVQYTVCDRNTLDGFQEFTVKGTLKWDQCNSSKEGDDTFNEVYKRSIYGLERLCVYVWVYMYSHVCDWYRLKWHRKRVCKVLLLVSTHYIIESPSTLYVPTSL